MDTDRLKELAPHYLAMVLLFFLVLDIIRVVVGEISIWIELAIVIAIVFAYRWIVTIYGLAPDGWE
ncbi:MAG: hypothetical protein ACOCY7_03060 [Halodesulfurarchaeum sp.]